MTAQTIASLSDADLSAALRAEVSNVPTKDITFALSLLASVGRAGVPSAKQRYWLKQLLDRARGAIVPTSERVKIKVGEFAGLNAIFDRAKKKLKKPAIVIAIAGREIKLDVAGAKARVPGSINVATNAPYGQSDWFGRILSTGEFEASPRVSTPAGLVDGLARFAAEPAKVAAEHGQLTGRCCFCNLTLTDSRSTSVGYGPTCAGNYGLPWGARVASEADMFKAA